jgi:hypothetical protein
LADLDFTHMQQREEHWAIVDLVGKGGHIRTVPVPEWVKATIDLWVAAAGISTGRLFRCICRAGKHWGDGVSERVVWHVVKQYARKLGLAQVAPHDLRRFVCKAVPCIRRRIGSDSILAGSRFRANDRTLPRMQTADSRRRERQHRDRTAAKLLWIGAQCRLYVRGSGVELGWYRLPGVALFSPSCGRSWLNICRNRSNFPILRAFRDGWDSTNHNPPLFLESLFYHRSNLQTITRRSSTI